MDSSLTLSGQWGGPGLPLGVPMTRHPEGWVLTLERIEDSRLLAVLSDGSWRSEVAAAAWPPPLGAALPDATLRALAQLRGAPLRLQMRTELDAWPWEAELAAAGVGVAARYLTDLAQAMPSATQATTLHTPLVAVAGADHLVLVRAARGGRRPLVLVSADWPSAQRLALESALRSHWRDPLLLSQALTQSLQQLDLPQGSCRLYGDGRAHLTDNEQGWRPVTAVSVDLVRSTWLLENLGPEVYALRLQAYHDNCRSVILRLHGSLGSPQGDDGFMAYFGFPQAVEDAATRALTAAWQVATSVRELDLQVRIGVASGQVVVSAQQAYAGVIHLAARLRGAALPGEVLIAPSTRDRVGSGFLLTERPGKCELRDFPSVQRIYRLDGLLAVTDANDHHRRGVGAFVGRQRELAQLMSAWDAACAGQLQWCVVRGEAGIGKSRLLQEYLRELRGRGHSCLEITGQANASSSPFAAVIDALRRHWAIDVGIDAEQLLHRLAAMLAPRQHATDIADLGDLLRMLPLSHQDDSPDATLGRRRWSELLPEVLRALIAAGPLCLLVDDAHWLDPSSIEVLRRLRDACGEDALMVVVGERTGAGRAPTMTGANILELRGLGAAEARELAEALADDLSVAVRERVIERAEGVPLYLEESLRMLSHGNNETDGDVPPKLEDLLMVRLDELGPDRALAQLLSVMGRDFSAVHLEALLEQDDPFVERARQQGGLRSLLSSGLLEAQEGALPGYRFKHALIRDAAYGSILAKDRLRIHGLLADLIERCTPVLGQQRPEHIAYHLEAAGRTNEALRTWLAAAQLSAARHAHAETVELASHALMLNAQRPEDAEHVRTAMRLHLLLASAKIALEGYGSAEVEAAYQAAERAGSVLGNTAQALRIRLGLEACCVMRGDLHRAGELAQACVSATEWDGDARLAMQARWALANVNFHQGDWHAALSGFEDCLAHDRPELHKRSSVQEPAVMCLGYSSWIQFERGEGDDALNRIDRMLSMTEAMQHPFSTGLALGFAASIKRLSGDIEGAWPHAVEAIRICERGGFRVWLAHAWMVRGQLRSDRGDLAGGDEDMARGYRLWVDGGARISCATYLVTRAELLLRQGRTAEATDAVTEAWQISEQIGERYYHAELLRLKGLCAWQGGDAGQAARVLNQALNLATAQKKPGLALRCALSLGALEARQGQWQACTDRLRYLLAGLPGHSRCRDWRWAGHALRSWTIERSFDHADHTPWEPR